MRTSRNGANGHGVVSELAGDAAAMNSSEPTKEALSAVRGTNEVDSEAFVEESDGTLVATNSTQHDATDMRRMGKDQQLIRRFRFFSVTAFVAIATAAWEIGLFLLTPGLVDGGRAGLIWNSLWNFAGFGPVYLSMAEMASMAPIAGAQYHWVR